MRSIELFAGAGGLAMGTSIAGFRHEAVIEFNKETCTTIRDNQRRGINPVRHWPLIEDDVRNINYSMFRDGLDLLSGGPPCQPFSLGGKHRGHMDARDMFPEAVRAVRELRPKAFIFENVKGLLREAFASYFEYIILQLTYPTLKKEGEEEWPDHLARLERHHTTGHFHDLTYRVVFRLLNAANYGVPQRRERVVIVGFREDLTADWSFPDSTHSQEALLWDQWGTGHYWERHRVTPSERPGFPVNLGSRLDRMRSLSPPAHMPWTTARDTFFDLPEPKVLAECDLQNHRYIPGARSYPGHTGSSLDEPAKTLKAGDHGVPGGENMLALYDGTVRYFTVRESARLQTFPDHYVFPVSWTESMRQLGNAVPVELARVVASSVRACLERQSN